MTFDSSFEEHSAELPYDPYIVTMGPVNNPVQLLHFPTVINFYDDQDPMTLEFVQLRVELFNCTTQEWDIVSADTAATRQDEHTFSQFTRHEFDSSLAPPYIYSDATGQFVDWKVELETPDGVVSLIGCGMLRVGDPEPGPPGGGGNNIP